MMRSPSQWPIAAALGHLGRALVEQSHVGDLVLRRHAATLRLAALAAGAQLAGDRAEDTGEQGLIDRLGAGPHRRIVRVGALEETGDLWRRPLPAELVGDRLPQRAADEDPLALRALPAQQRLVVRPPRLIAAVRLGATGDLSIDGLERLADPGGDLLDRDLGGEPVGDGDPIVLGQEARRDRGWLG